MWLLPEWRLLRSHSLDVFFDSCMWGSCRKKSTRFLTTCVEMLSLARTCDNKHSHASWLPVGNKGSIQYATAQEAACPHELCQAMSSALQLQAASFNLEIVRECPLEQSSHAAAASARRQPKLSKYKPLLEDFKYRVTVAVDSVEHLPLDDKSCLKVALPSVPAGAKLLRRPVKGVSSASGLGPLGLGPSAPASGLGFPSPSVPVGRPLASFGIYRSPSEFVSAARDLEHPFDSCKAVPDRILEIVASLLSSSPVDMLRHRLSVLHKWKTWARELQADEDRLHESLDPGVASVLKGKKLLLLRKVATSLGWPDEALHDELIRGFRITGLQDASGVFGLDPRPASSTKDDLLKQSKHLRPALWAKIKGAPLDSLGRELWDITYAEYSDKSWLEEPRTFSQLEQMMPEGWIPTRRFPVVQHDKLRPIDDLTECGTNGACSTLDKLDLRALDETVFTAMLIMRCLESRCFALRLDDGRVLRGRVHPYWLQHPDRARVLVKTVDLKSAYKQLALHPDDRRFSVISLKDPADDEPKGFLCRVLPFVQNFASVCTRTFGIRWTVLEILFCFKALSSVLQLYR